jgi:patatin-related protein
VPQPEDSQQERITGFAPLKEVRFAVVIYGGVSLAIYINGIVKEMLSFVRATAPARDTSSDTPLLKTEEELVGSAKVYRKLGQILNDPDGTPTQLLDAIENTGAPQPIRTRFVIDILSGTSAGGINAIFLGKALANNQDLDGLEQLWISQGNIEALINDRKSLKGPLTRQNPPQSLLNSHRMYLELLSALDGMDREDTKDKGGNNPNLGEDVSPLVDRLDLFSTTTDIRGLTLPINLTDGVVYERRHKNVFHFQHPSDDPQTPTDFGSDCNPFLAYAARCTSAFPFAFEPMELADIGPIVSTADAHVGKDYTAPNSRYWERFYPDYVRSGITTPLSQPFHTRAFGDGGYLDNKPFSYAIDTTLIRHTDLPVERKLVYIEPNPEILGSTPDSGGRPNAIENSLAALLVLPRYETIREDLERVVNRNLEIERLSRIMHEVRDSLDAPEWHQKPDAWINLSATAFGPGYATYERLKLSTVADELADLMSVSFGVDVRGAFGQSIRILGSEWRDLQFTTIQAKRRFLFDFDVQYRLRRIRYVRRRIQEEYVEPTLLNQVNTDNSREYLKEYRQALHMLKAELGEPFARLQRLIKPPMLPPDQPLPDVFEDSDMSLVAEPPTDPARWLGLDQYPRATEKSDRGARERARYVLEVLGRGERVRELAKRVSMRFAPELIAAGNAIEASYLEIPNLIPAARRARAFVRKQYEGFDSYDSVAFPITFGTDVDDNGPISVHRISPNDATARDFDVLRGRLKLRGQLLGSFGAFLDEDWRRNDILWGRLDGAERLISMVIPGSDRASANLRSRLIDQAHEEIVVEFRELDDARRANWKKELRDFIAEVPAEPSPQLVAKSAARSTAVVGDLLEGISDAYASQAKPLFRRMAFLGRVSWSFVEVSVPRSIRELFGNYWMQLALLFSVTLVVLAMFTGNSGATSLAITVTAIVLVVYGLRELLRRYLRGATVFAPVVLAGLTVTATAALTAMAVYLSSVSLTTAWNQLRGKTNGTSWQEWFQQVQLALSHTGIFFLPICAAAITALAGMIAANASYRARRLRGDVDPVRALKLSVRWHDVLNALGLPEPVATTGADQANAGDSTSDRASHAAAMRAAVTRAESIREFSVRAIRADYVFATAYGTLFFAIGLYFLWGGARLQSQWLDVGLSSALLGLGGSVSNFQVNDRVLRVLASAPPSDPRESIAEPPRGLNILKWVAIVSAVGCALLALWHL